MCLSLDIDQSQPRFDLPLGNIIKQLNRKESLPGNMPCPQEINITPHNPKASISFMQQNAGTERDRTKPKTAEANVSRKRELVQAIKHASQRIKCRKQNSKAMYSNNNQSITGISIVSALQPRLNLSVDRSNIYAIKCASAKTQQVQYNSRAGLMVKERKSVDRRQVGTQQRRRPSTNSSQVKPNITAKSFMYDFPAFEFSTPVVNEVSEDTSTWTDMNKFLKALLQKESEAIAKFLYFNLKGGKDNPYELEISNYLRRCPERYYTISSEGVTRYDHEAAVELVPLKEWLVERELYGEVKSFSFFKNFHKWKVLNNWKKRIWSVRKRQIIEELEDKLFVLDPIYRTHLLRYRKSMCDLSNLRILDLNRSSDTNSLEEFNQRQERKRREVLAKIKEISKKSKGDVRDLIKEALNKLRESILSENSSSNTMMTKMQLNPNEGTSIGNMNAAFKEINFPDNLNYGSRVNLRRECTRFLRLAYLVDFMGTKSLSDVYISSAGELINMLSYLDQNAQAEVNAGQNILRKAARVEPILIVKVLVNMANEIPKNQIKETPILPFNEKTCKVKDFDLSCHIEMDPEKVTEENYNKKRRYARLEVPDIINHWIELIPSKMDFYQQIVSYLDEGMKVLETFERWSKNEELKPYVNILEDWDEIIGGNWNSPDIDFLLPLNTIDKDPLFVSHKNTLKEIVYSGYAKCQDFLKMLNKYLNHCWRNERANLGLIFCENVYKPGETLIKVFNLFEYQKKTFTAKIPENCNLGFIKIDCIPVRKSLIPIPIEYIKRIENLGNDTAKMRLNKVEDWISCSRKKLELKVDTVDDYVRQKISWNEIANAYKENKEQVDIVGEIYEAMNLFEIKIKKDDKQRHPKIAQETSHLNQLLSNVSDQQELNLDKFKRKLQDQLVPALQDNLEKLQKEVEDEMLLTYQENTQKVIDHIALLDERFQSYAEQCKKYNIYQEKMNLEVHDFDIVEVMAEELSLRRTLWDSLKQWKALTSKWSAQQFVTIDPKEIATITDEYSAIAFRLDKELPENPVSKQFKSMVDTFIKAVPIIKALRNEFLKKTHWKDIKELLRSEFEVTDSSFTLRSLLDLEAANFNKEIQQISVQATRENQLEVKIAAIDSQWKSCAFIVKEFVIKDEYILVNIEEICNLLDQSMVSIIAILEDKYIKPFLSQTEDWRKRLAGLMQIMEEWEVCQKQWIYFHGIFSSNEIRNQLANEGGKFDAPDKFFRSLMQKAKKNPNPLRLLKMYKGDLLEHLKHTNRAMEEIHRLLLDYVEAKQLVFPRFYFLGSEEVIRILSNIQHLDGLKQYLPKLFDSASEIALNENGDIVALVSLMKEQFKFYRSIRVKENVESCLEQIQSGVKETLMRLLKAAIKDYDEIERKDWIRRHHCQIVLVIAKIVWCNATESTILEQSVNQGAMIEWYEELVKDIQQTTEVSKDDTLPLPTKKTVDNALVMQVHFRDIIEDLVLNNIVHINDYAWQKVLRFYWEDDDPAAQQSAFISVKAGCARIIYGNEYIGPSSLTINNPPTDRAWLNIFASLDTHMAIGLLGADEIGKKETLRSLARSTGTYFVDINCPANSSHRLLSRSIAGAIQDGMWVSMQGIASLDPGVLSVMAKQLTEVMNAFRRGAETLIFNEKEIQIKEGCGIFAIITKHSFTLTRVAHDNFRIVSMVEPDIESILSVLLLTERFSHTKALARRLSLFSQIARGLLRNYDFGIHCLKSIICVAVALRKANASLTEDASIVTAIHNIVEPKIRSDDRQIYSTILADLFPGIAPCEADNASQRQLIENALVQKGYSKIPVIIEKAMQVVSLLEVYKGIMIIGPPCSGKSVLIKTLYDVYNLKTNRKEDSEEIILSLINPNSLTLSELYGVSNSLTQEWIDGLIPMLVRDKSTLNRWLVFDGMISLHWIELLNSVLGLSSILSLGNSERIYLKPTTKLFFESDSLSCAAPATVSRCGIVHLPNDSIKFTAYIESWLSKTYQNDTTLMTQDYKDYLMQLFDQSIERALIKVKSTCSELEHLSDCQFLPSICNILESMLIPENFVAEKSDKKRLIAQIYCFAFIWGIGGQLNEIEREKLDSVARGLLETCDIPTAQPVFEYYIEPKKGAGFKLWSESVPAFTPQAHLSFWELVVPTVDTVRQDYFLESLFKKLKHVYVTGNTVCGKSVITRNFIEQNDSIERIEANFTTESDANIIQSSIEEKLQKKRVDLYSAPAEKRNVILIDDANLPLSNKRTSELLRQLVEHKGWYDRSKFFWKNVESTSVVCVGSINNISERLIRHFNQFYISPLSIGAFDNIFRTLIDENMKRKGFSETLLAFIPDIVSNTIYSFHSICERVKAVPGKFVYTFSARDLARLFEKLCVATSASVNSVQSLESLWVHEFSRAFLDPVVDELDRDWVNTLLSDCVVKVFKSQINLSVYWTFSMNPETKKKEYKEIGDMNELKNFIQVKFDQCIQKSPLISNIILYNDMLDILVKVINELEQPRGYFFLIGNSGVGKFTIIKLAGLMQNINIHKFKKEPTIEHAKSIFKELLQSTGVQGNYECLLISQKSYTLPESVLEMIRLLIVNREIPGLFSQEEIEKILTDMRPLAAAQGRDGSRKSLFTIFLERVQRYLKIVFCCEPGNWLKGKNKEFRKLRKFCRIIWAPDWSSDAMKAMARKCLSGLEGCSSDTKNIIENVFKEIHSLTTTYAIDFNNRFHGCITITPSYYIDALKQFKMLFNQMKQEPNKLNDNLWTGLSNYKKFKDKSAKSDSELQKLLQEKTELAEKQQKSVMELQKSMIEAETVLSEENKKLKEREKLIKNINDEIDAELNPAKQDLNAALNELAQCDKKVFTDIKTAKNPTACLKLVMEATMTILQERTDWAGVKALLSDPSELMGKIAIVSEKIPTMSDMLIKRVKAGYLDNSEFDPEHHKGKTAMSKPFAHWVRAVVFYYNVYIKTSPKRELCEAERTKYNEESESVNAMLKALNEKKEMMAQLRKSIEDLQYDKVKIAEEMAELKSRSTRLEEFFLLFDEDEVRWDNDMRQRKGVTNDVIGDTLFASAFIVYLSQFSKILRKKLIEKWTPIILAQNLSFDNNLYLKTIMEKQNKAEELFGNGLPKSQFSLENVIISLNSNKWPLIIDPYSFASKWIKAEYSKYNLVVLKFSQRDYMRSLAHAIRLGRPVLIEDVDDLIDPLIDPLLSRNIVEKEPGTFVLCMDNNEYEYESSFRLMMTSKTFSPINANKVTLINFDLDSFALEEMLLDQVIKQEVPEEEAERQKFNEQVTKDKKVLKEIDDKMLNAFAGGSIEQLIEDERSYESLKTLKNNYQVALEQIAEDENAYQEQVEKKEEYKRVINRARVIYSTAKHFASVFVEHRFSFANFLETFVSAIEPSKEPLPRQQRIASLKENITRKLCAFMEQGMNKYHRMIFAFSVCMQILESEVKLSNDVFERLVKDDYPEGSEQNPLPQFMDAKGFSMAQEISTGFPQFEGLINSLKEDSLEWKDYANNGKVPVEWNKKLSAVDKLLLSKLFFKRSLYCELLQFIHQFSLPVLLNDNEENTEAVFAKGKKATPILIITHGEVIPLQILKKYAMKRKFQDKLTVITLGQDQAQQAKRMIQSAQGKGDWILVDNCQLAEGGTKELDMLMDQIREPKNPSHEDFRIFFSSASVDTLPKNMIENSIKLVLERPKGVKQRAQLGYQCIASIEPTKKEEEFKKIMLGLCMFHAIVNETALRGGFYTECIYGYNYLESAAEIVNNLMDESDELFWSEIEFLVAETLYGKRLTVQGDKDKLTDIFRAFCSKDILSSEYMPLLCSNYAIPDDPQKYLENLPDNDPSDFFNLVDSDWEKKRVIQVNSHLINLFQRIEFSDIIQKETATKPSTQPKWISELIDSLPIPLNVQVYFIYYRRLDQRSCSKEELYLR